MNKIGIRAHDIGRYQAHVLTEKVDAFGFDGVQLVFRKALDHVIDFDHLDSLENAFNKPFIMMLGAYFNPVHPNPNEVQKGVEYFKKHLEVAAGLKTKYVGTETGSYQGSPWTYHPMNHTDEALEKAVHVFRDLALYAKKHHVYLVLEGAYAHIAYSPKRLKEMIEKINCSSIKVTVDLFNYLNLENYQDHLAILEDAIMQFGDDIVIFHLKDFMVNDNQLIQVGLGKGLMNYPEIIEMIQSHCPKAFLIFEGVTGEDIKPSYDYIKRLLEKGV